MRVLALSAYSRNSNLAAAPSNNQPNPPQHSTHRLDHRKSPENLLGPKYLRRFPMARGRTRTLAHNVSVKRFLSKPHPSHTANGSVLAGAFGDAPNVDWRRSRVKWTTLLMFRHRWKINLLETEPVPFYPTKVSSNSPDAVKAAAKQDAGYPLHAFKKVSNVCSLRMVADTKTCSAGFS